MATPLVVCSVLAPSAIRVPALLLVALMQFVAVPLLGGSTLFARTTIRALGLQARPGRTVAVVLEPRRFLYDDFGKLWIEGAWLHFEGDGVELHVHARDVLRIDQGTEDRGLALATRGPILRLAGPVDDVDGVTIQIADRWTLLGKLSAGRALRQELESWLRSSDDAPRAIREDVTLPT